MKKEVWKDVKGYEGIYSVSDKGRLKSLKRVVKIKNNHELSVKEKILKPFTMKSGYVQYKLSKNGKGKSNEIHQLVAVAFLNHTPCGHNIVVDHIDNNKSNNNIENLQIITHRENCSKDKKGDYVGVYTSVNGRYYSQIYTDNKRRHLGTFETPKKAKAAYNNELLIIKNKKQ